MGMTIDNANKLLSVITATITEDDDCFTIEDENLQVFKETLLTAVDTMRKYQKIQEIINSAKGSDGAVKYNWLYEQISEVVEDGNNK